MGLEILPLRRKCAVDQRTAFEKGIKILYERALMVVPPEAKLLVVLHGTCDFVPSFLHRKTTRKADENANKANEQLVVTYKCEAPFPLPVSRFQLLRAD